MKRFILLFTLVVLIFIAGCQNHKILVNDSAVDPSDTIPAETGSFSDTDITTDTAAATAADTEEDQDIVNTLDDLYRSFHPLKIQKNGDSTVYEAARPLVYIFGDMLSKVEEVYTDTSEDMEKIQDFDYGKYNYRLKFDGAKDILFAREGNMLRFEGEKKIYYLWGSADTLWDNLIFDDTNKTVDIDGEKIQVMCNTYNEDVDGDGKAENIELVYERGKTEDFRGSLVIRVNGSEAVVMEGDEWFTKPYRTIGQMPEIEFLPEKDGKSKALLVIHSWATNGVGSTGVINAYKYANGSVSEVKVKDAEAVIKLTGDEVISIDFPEQKKNMELKIYTKEFIEAFGGVDLLGQRIEEDHIYKPHPYWYLVNDYNGDGLQDLCCESIIRIHPFALCKLYSYYRYEGGEIRPVQIYINPCHNVDEKELYLKEFIFSVISQKGYLTIGDNGIAEDEIEPLYDYTADEELRMLEELQNEKILKAKGDRLYIDF